MQTGLDGTFDFASNDVGVDFDMAMDPFGIDASLCFPTEFTF
jgi:hypothetical protein